jgi:hypothetical protein
MGNKMAKVRLEIVPRKGCLIPNITGLSMRGIGTAKRNNHQNKAKEGILHSSSLAEI